MNIEEKQLSFKQNSVCSWEFTLCTVPAKCGQTLSEAEAKSFALLKRRKEK